MSQRNGFLVGLIIALFGTAVLGTDRLTASADVTSFFGQTTTPYTFIGLGLLVFAAGWFFLFKPKSEVRK